MRWLLPACVLLPVSLAFCQDDAPGAPADLSQTELIRAAWRDVYRLPEGLRAEARYFDLTAVPPAERPAFAAVFSGHLNQLSREVEIRRPFVVKDANGQLLRVFRRWYGWPAQVWEELADPLYLYKLRVATNYTPRVTLRPSLRPPRLGTTYREDLEPAPHLRATPELTAVLNGLTGATGTRLPVTRADWFLWQTAVSEGRGKAGYYDWLGIRDQKTFERLCRFSAELTARLEHRRAVIKSGITQQNRRVELVFTTGGEGWRTFDSAETVDRKDPVEVLDDAFQFDVTEQIFPLPNKLRGYLLANNKGTRQDTAPANIIKGVRYRAKDSRLHVCLDCVACHNQAKGEAFVKDIDFAPLLHAASVDYDQEAVLRAQYQRHPQFKLGIERARQDAATAVKDATGLAPEAWGREFHRWYVDYDERPVDAAVVARDFGVTRADLLRRFRAYDAGTKGYLRPTLSVIANGGSIGVVQYHSFIPAVYDVLQATQGKH